MPSHFFLYDLFFLSSSCSLKKKIKLNSLYLLKHFGSLVHSHVLKEKCSYIFVDDTPYTQHH